MEVYNAMRHFADSWGMLGMLLFFVVALAFVFQALMKELPLRTQLDLIEESR